MSKNKKKSFWGEKSVSEKSQLKGMDDLIRLTTIVETGGPIPQMDLMEDDDVEESIFNEEIGVGIDDAIARLKTKNNSGEMPDGFSPLTKANAPIPEVDRIIMDEDATEEPVIREMEVVEPEKPVPVSAPKMMPPHAVATVTAEDVIKDAEVTPDAEPDDDAFEYDDSRPLEYGDIQLITTNDDWIYITNAYNMDLRVSICIFNLRGYNVQKDDMYNLMMRYVPLMVAILAGPALIVKQDNPTFRKFMRSSVDRGINIDKDKFMIFTVENTEDKMFIVYVMDAISREGILEEFLPPMVENGEETDFFVQLAGLVLNPVINPYGMIETMWPGDRASAEVDTEEKTEEFCNLMMKELGIESVESSRTSYSSAEAAFKKKSVIGNIQNFLKTVKIAQEALQTQMNPDNYEEKFLETESNETVEAASQESVPVTGVSATDTEELFDGVGEDASEEIPAAEVQTPEPPKDADPAPAPVKPPKAGADGKKVSSKKFEIPVQR